MDKRVSARSRVLKVGTIEFEGGSLSCMVRSLSNIGGALDVADPQGIPEQFTLVWSSSAHVIWWRGKRIGVAFDRIAPGLWCAPVE